MAVARENEVVLQVLLCHGASPDLKSEVGFPPLWLALQKFSGSCIAEAMARVLIKHQASAVMVYQKI